MYIGIYIYIYMHIIYESQVNATELYFVYARKDDFAFC